MQILHSLADSFSATNIKPRETCAHGVFLCLYPSTPANTGLTDVSQRFVVLHFVQQRSSLLLRKFHTKFHTKLHTNFWRLRDA